MKVLVAEHDATSRLILRKALERIGHECLAARDGTEAWDLFVAEAPSVLITDWQLPGVDAPSLVSRVRAAPSPCYVVMLTARRVGEDGPAGPSAAADRYLTKPLDHAQLRLALLDAERATPGRRHGAPDTHPLSSEPSTPDPAEPLDLALLAALTEELADTTLLTSMIAGFLDRTPARLAEIRAAVEREEVDVVDRAAHSLRGAAATLGARSIAAVCAELEAAGRAGRLATAAPLLGRLEQAFADTEPLLRARA